MDTQVLHSKHKKVKRTKKKKQNNKTKKKNNTNTIKNKIKNDNTKINNNENIACRYAPWALRFARFFCECWARFDLRHGEANIAENLAKCCVRGACRQTVRGKGPASYSLVVELVALVVHVVLVVLVVLCVLVDLVVVVVFVVVLRVVQEEY